ncbi:methyltransferase domain-containing protein [Ensifer sp. ENS12]|uniref:methyltransferase domain-containing protein n=1 Tax=Ensifer sp. ENS12 TaxID=2854774 RepID=UPI001C45D5F4|nr:methyltransferase domain-containing protein [Ensifer sp. ENS12]MBV7522596.1 methyltransferase domain-containing protein [Ensifer sp. ENS12]
MALEVAVAALPEKYQPIYRHEELSNDASRGSEDRLEQIVRVYDSLSAFLKRPLRVLDIGCAQGFFSFTLAERGAVVTGIDMDQRNVDVCECLKSLYPQLQVSFRTQRAERVVMDLKDGQYDIILGFSVFHHIIYENGLYYAIDLMSQIAQKTGVLIAELALNSEPLYWAKHLPSNERELLKPFPFVMELTRHKTHLSSIQRPIFVASGRYCVLQDYVQTFTRWSNKSNQLAVDAFGGSRSYFSNDHAIAKVYRFGNAWDQINRRDMERERKNLSSLPESATKTSLITSIDTTTESWTVIKRSAGMMLSDIIGSRISFDQDTILEDVLRQLAFYEAQGLYHNDVRTWNVIVDQQGRASLIDLASLTEEKRDCSSPDDLFLSFFIFLHEIINRDENFDGGGAAHQRQHSINPFSLPEPYRNWAVKFWHSPPADWSFARLLASFEKRDETATTDIGSSDLWCLATEAAINESRRKMLSIDWELDQLRQNINAIAGANHPVKLPTKEDLQLGELIQEIATIREELSLIRQQRDRYLTQITSLAQQPGGVSFYGSQLRTVVGTADTHSIATSGIAGTLAFGPYTAMDRGVYKITFLFSHIVHIEGCVVDVVASFGRETIVSASSLIRDRDEMEWTFQVATERDYSDVEFRVMVEESTQLKFQRVSLEKVA